MCSQFKGAELISLSTIQEKNWVAKIISENIWLHAVGPAFFPKRMLSTVEKKITQRVLTDIEELCLQMLPGEGHLVTVPCSDNASWICKAPLAFIPVDAPEKCDCCRLLLRSAKGRPSLQSRLCSPASLLATGNSAKREPWPRANHTRRETSPPPLLPVPAASGY
ncbi:hypothetical protein NXF25_005389 [Crotalus adamanteus]|uniref:Uncharacterized protein n=1 Tax=Crotalus adamanteus TaxID=8729 RepID=A0AAW1BX64_CROAD